MLYQEWICPPVDPQADERLAAELGIGLLAARVLRSRGLGDADAARAFLQTTETRGADPFLLPDMDKAVRRIELAVAEGETVAVIGDYDADGVTALYVLTDYLRTRGVNTLSHIPDREKEGYGVSIAAVERLASMGASLIVTVDTGITAHDAAKRCAELGIDLVITDHHTCLSTLPDAIAVVDPWREDSPECLRVLAGVGVAYKLVCALSRADEKTVLARYGDAVCVGTVADVMPVTGENRKIVAAGLDKLGRYPHPGLAALLSASGCEPPYTTQTVAFRLAPRINAPGRMSSAYAALDLFLAEDDASARIAAEELCRQNVLRQQVEQTIREEAEQMLEQRGFSAERDGAVFLCDEGWHPGVLGIVCARLAEKYACPAVLATRDGDVLKASARSVRGVHLHKTLSALSAHVIQFGGHELAAGLTLSPDRAEDFARALQNYVLQHRDTSELLAPRADCEVTLDELTVPSVAALSVLEPFGEGNPEPLLLLRGTEISESVPLKEGRHTRLRVGEGRGVAALCFGRSPEEVGLFAGDRADLIFTARENVFRGTSSVSLTVRCSRPHADQSSLLFERLLSGQRLCADQAVSLLPEREQFTAVWRCLCRDGRLPRAASLSLSEGQLAVILHTFSQMGLTVEREGVPCAVQGHAKVDLFSAPIMQSLRSMI